MQRTVVLALLALFVGMGVAGAQGLSAPVPQGLITPGFRVLVGYQYIDLDVKFTHNTHPADFFLPNASVPGSAGTTKLGGANFLSVGIGYRAAHWRPV